MKLVFSGLENPLLVEPGSIAVLEIENRTLFARVCQSLASSASEGAVEPYTLWDHEGKQLASKSMFKIVSDPFSLPWTDRDFVSGLYQKMQSMLLDHEAIKSESELLNLKLMNNITTLGLMMTSDYAFKVEWDLQRYLKAFDFGLDYCSDDSLLDNLIKFLTLSSDISFKKTFIFMNLKTFLSEKDIATLYEQVIFSNNSLLLLENLHDKQQYVGERKLHVDQSFLEIII